MAIGLFLMTERGLATYSLWRDEEDYRIHWSTDAARIKRLIDSVGTPYKGASALMETRRVRILDAAVEPDIQVEDRKPRKVVFLREGSPIVICGRGLLRITDMRDDATGNTLPRRRRTQPELAGHKEVRSTSV
jgi:methionyl-tRNA formyltransferase